MVIGVAARTTAQATLLRAVHGQPGGTRAAVAQELGMPSGFAAETVARLVAARLLSEQPAPPTGSQMKLVMRRTASRPSCRSR